MSPAAPHVKETTFHTGKQQDSVLLTLGRDLTRSYNRCQRLLVKVLLSLILQIKNQMQIRSQLQIYIILCEFKYFLRKPEFHTNRDL